ncbi:ABC transporter substrate-binding protein [Falsirhodobacter algicola]|uniref:ABC transporter substrate-binding protein n=1 Tax=Falsirhodobacter algicola TaxID=2692330 RepID=A0A8J8MRZ4_9RHOB|nr:ABC transporter substrate-binding protein [Falsirhodobacter algicola]QUS35377.1 ABC transporter substrate-binding protein [Falsirhodobacter algicola]
MKRIMLATAATALLAGTAQAEDVKVGVIFGFTGPLESITPAMADGAELAMKEVSESGAFLDGSTVTPVRADSTCVDATAATAAAERLVTAEGVKGIVGADCSGVSSAVLQNVSRPNGIVQISPSSTSPGLSQVEDDGLFFRTAPSDARQGEVMADIISERGITSAAVTYTNNDYGLGLANSFAEAFKAKGGEVTIQAAHDDGKADYSAEIGALSSAGGEILVVAGYVDQGGRGIVQGALDSGAFDTFYFPDGMYGQTLLDAFGDDIEGSFGDLPSADGDNANTFQTLAKDAGFDGTSPYTGESYDAAALMLLAMQAAGSSDPAEYKDHLFDVANAPGEKILPGELAKGLQLLSEGQDIDYVGATGVEFVEPGESRGTFREYDIKDGAFETVGFR